jgi:hypothetical protein
MTPNKIDITAQLTTCQEGLTAHYPATQTWTFNGTTYKRGDIINALQGVIDAAKATEQDHQKWRDAVAAEVALREQLRPVLTALRQWLESQWGGASSPKLAQFGFKPTKPRIVSAASKAAGAARARATRKAKKAALDALKAGAAPVVAPAVPAPVATPAPSPVVAPPAAAAPTKGS